MTTVEQLKRAWTFGYDSGNVLALVPSRHRRQEERLVRGSFRRFFKRAVEPHLRPDSVVLELGPGRGAWTRALLSRVPQGQVHTADLLDVTPWLRPEQYGGRLVCHQQDDNSFAAVPDGAIDFFFSFGVLCHNTTPAIGEILSNALPKMKPGGIAVHQYGDWDKLHALGWHDDSLGVQAVIKELPDEHQGNFWPRNDPEKMAAVCREAGWIVEEEDLGLFERDSIVRLRAPGA
jgi:SAM-dependent methyltransferase